MIVYLDTSALAKLYVEEPGMETVKARLAPADVVATSVIVYPELRAAFNRDDR
jgi:uncharacterized protein with PIN domain